jgi:hypothetical protein
METHDATKPNDAGGAGIIRAAQSRSSYLSRTDRAKAQTKPRPRKCIEAGLKLAALSCQLRRHACNQAYTSGSR